MECLINDLPVYYEVYGEGRPVIMIHGYYPDHRLMSGCMEPIFERLTGWKRIYMDLPGMGRTPSREWIKNSDVMLEVILKFIDSVIPGENFLIAGESYGGYLARGVLSKKSDAVDGMLLLCSMVIADYAERRLPEHTVIIRDEKLLAGLEPADAAEFDSMAVVQSPEIWERYDSEINSGVKMADSKFLENLRENGYEYTFNVDAPEFKFERPVSIITGRQDDSVGYKDAWDILENYPRGTFAVLDRAGHNLQIEQVGLFNELVKDWLRRVEEF